MADFNNSGKPFGAGPMKGLIALVLSSVTLGLIVQPAFSQTTNQQKKDFVLELDDAMLAELSRRNGLKSFLPDLRGQQFGQVLLKYVGNGARRTTPKPRVFDTATEGNVDASGLNSFVLPISAKAIEQLKNGEVLGAPIDPSKDIGLVKIVMDPRGHKSTPLKQPVFPQTTVWEGINLAPTRTRFPTTTVVRLPVRHHRFLTIRPNNSQFGSNQPNNRSIGDSRVGGQSRTQTGGAGGQFGGNQGTNSNSNSNMTPLNNSRNDVFSNTNTYPQTNNQNSQPRGEYNLVGVRREDRMNVGPRADYSNRRQMRNDIGNPKLR